MKILVNDHAGHPFQVQLSRSLARRGHSVLHTFTAQLQTPRGALIVKEGDPPGLEIRGIRLKQPFDRYGLFTRYSQEKELGNKLVQTCIEYKPDVVLSANTPLGAQRALLNICKRNQVKFVFWLQDLLGVGIRNNLRKRVPFLGSLIGAFFIRMEESLLARSDAVVVITEDFVPIVARAGVPDEKIHIIYNWAPLEDMPRHDKENHWSLKYGLSEKFCFLYSGTLGMKHNPELLVQLAKKFSATDDTQVVVITEGLGADYLRSRKTSLGLRNLVLLPFQPFEELPMVIATADVLVAILEPDAGVFAVPSKVLTYLCAQRPLLLALPPENLAARIVMEAEAGIVTPPTNMSGFLKAAERLRNDERLRARLAANGWRYAMKTFDIEKITDRFEAIFRA